MLRDFRYPRFAEKSVFRESSLVDGGCDTEETASALIAVRAGGLSLCLEAEKWYLLSGIAVPESAMHSRFAEWLHTACADPDEYDGVMRSIETPALSLRTLDMSLESFSCLEGSGGEPDEQETITGRADRCYSDFMEQCGPFDLEADRLKTLEEFAEPAGGADTSAEISDVAGFWEELRRPASLPASPAALFRAGCAVHFCRTCSVSLAEVAADAEYTSYYFVYLPEKTAAQISGENGLKGRIFDLKAGSVRQPGTNSVAFGNGGTASLAFPVPAGMPGCPASSMSRGPSAAEIPFKLS